MHIIQTTIKKILTSGVAVVMMTTCTGCATTDEQSNNDKKTKIVLSKDVFADNNLSNSDRICYYGAFKEVRNAEAEKYFSDANIKKDALKCFDACGGAFIKQNGKCQYMPSRYELKNNSCFCNGQDIVPQAEKEQAELKLAACQEICKAANSSTTTYEADWSKTRTFGECVCKIVTETNGKQH